MRLSERLAPMLYDAVNKGSERELVPQRRELLSAALGRVLEIGVGTGFNLPHYPDTVAEIVVTDPNEAMLERARRRAAEAGVVVSSVRAPAQSLPFADETFDTVVSTLVLCSVPDQREALREIRRVLKPDGRLLFIEHVRWDEPERAKWQDRLAGVWRVVADGCHPNRDTLAEIERNGFVVVDVERGSIPKSPPIVRPYVAGRAARKP